MANVQNKESESIMNRILAGLVVASLAIALSSPAQALIQFRKAFQEKYVDKNEHPEIKAAFRKAGCFTCHIKGTTEKDIRNRYAHELSKLIEGDAQDRIKEATANGRAARDAEVDKLLKELDQAFEKVAKMKSPTGESYEERIKAGQLPIDPETAKPATDENGKEIPLETQTVSQK
jgi:hypothetical protein